MGWSKYIIFGTFCVCVVLPIINFCVQYNGGWWDTAKMLWRYGYLSPKRTETLYENTLYCPILRYLFQNSVQNVIKKFLSFYSRDSPKWENISKLANVLNWAPIVNTTTEEYLLTQGVSQKYIGEIVEAATRDNYGQVSRFNFRSQCCLNTCAEC